MAVGFDIDDTVLFPARASGAAKTFSPESEDYLKNPVFWEKMNNGWDEFSIPKEVARQLIDMHVRRGDAIFFVTGRSPTKTETVSKTLADNFHIPVTNMNPVIFAGDKPWQNTKSQWLQDKNIRIFMAIPITILPLHAMSALVVSAFCAPPTLPTNPCHKRVRLVKR